MSYEHPLAEQHLILENDFKKLCQTHHYKVTDISYHHNFQSQQLYNLRNDSSPTSLSVRLSPDMIVSKGNDSVFYELKTGRSRDIIRMEAYQLMLNQIREIHFRTPCIYVYRGIMSNNKMIGCHAKDIIANTLVIPDVQKNEQVKPLLEEYFDCEKRVKKIGYQFSGDAYIEVSNIENWQPISNFIK